MSEPPVVVVTRAADLPFRSADGNGAAGLALARLYQAADRSFTFQLARIEPGGVSRRHRHDWEQVNFVVSGEGMVDAGGSRLAIGAGDCVFFPGGVDHAIANTGAEPLLLVAALGAGA